MPTINLSDYIPEARDGSRTLLPKQQEFYNRAIDKFSSRDKYLAYIGGIGSGKSVIGCITIRNMAILEAGDYLVCRQFMPELKMTTYKQFIDLMPSELIIEHRIADAHLRIRAMNGISNIFFRPLEEPDKMRSLNLNAFLIDEANQVSEEAFLLLQGRLRGKAWRKGMIVSNPNGHDWVYNMFLKKDGFKNNQAKDMFALIRAPSTENIHLPEDYLLGPLATWSADRIKREIEGSFDAFEGAVYSEFRRDVHVIKSFKIPSDWRRHIRIDHGYRNPAAVLFFAIGPDGEVYLYREFYQSEYLINEIMNGNKKENKKGIVDLVHYSESFDTAKIDPSTKSRRGTTGESDFDEYYRLWPKKWPPLGLANNDVNVGIDRVKSYLKVNNKTQKPLLYIFDTCQETIEEITQYRYEELRSGQVGLKSEKEKPRKVNDHAMDALRYMIVDLPDPTPLPKEAEKIKPGTLEYSLKKELEGFKKPKNKDPWGE